MLCNRPMHSLKVCVRLYSIDAFRTWEEREINEERKKEKGEKEGESEREKEREIQIRMQYEKTHNRQYKKIHIEFDKNYEQKL